VTSGGPAGRGRVARDALRDSWRAGGIYPGLTTGEAIVAGCTAHAGDQIVFARVDTETTTVSLGELLSRARDRAARLATAGVSPGDTVLVQTPADLPGTEVLLGVWLLGAVAVPMATTATAAEVAHAARETDAAGAVLAPAWRGRDLLTPIMEEGGRQPLRYTIVLGTTAPRGVVALDLVPPRTTDVAAPLRPDPTSVACVLYTSGSTAAPKGVRHSHETLLCGLSAVPADTTTRMLATFPAGHVASLLGLLRPLTAGGTTVVMDRWSARAAAELIEAYRITTSAGTPFFLSTLLDEAGRTGRDISSLQRFLCGAAAVPPSLVERSEKAGIVTWRTYGSTEHPAISSGNPVDPADKRRLTDGRVTPGNEVRILGEDDGEVTAGEEGEIVARGPKQFLGYQDAAADATAFVHETWFRTGDLGRFDADGYLVVTDRLKDVIIRGGENISAREVEELLGRHDAVAEVAVCAAPDEVWGEVVCAVVVPRKDRPRPTLKDLREAAAELGLAAHKAPARLVFTDALPRTAAGKVRKRDLRSLI
jgi:acyl-CoA synthetase (AMP-forming)/AMP-acid ligase II